MILLALSTSEIGMLLLTLLNTIGWGIYVYFTWKTFREIKKQTDLQSRSHLIINTTESEEVESYEEDIEIVPTQLYNEWKDILRKNYPQGLQATSKVLLFKLMNRGKADVDWWDLKLKGKISHGKFLEKTLKASPETFNLQIKSDYNQQILSKDEICIPIIILGAFPQIELSWEVTYGDTHTAETYKIKSNGFAFSSSNKIVFDAK